MDREQRLTELLDYLDAWTALQTQYWAWIDAEYARRLKAFKDVRKLKRRELVKAVKLLKFADNGRVINQRGGRQAKRKFQTARDRALLDVVRKAKIIFGYQGGPNAAGIFDGQLAPELRSKIMKQLQGLV